MGWKHWIGAWVVVSLVACSADEHTSSTDQAATTQNGAWQNGLTSNALFSNGAWQNGAWQNGVLQNGAWQNGAWQNGAWQNGAWQNGAWQNGAWQNGAWQNGAWQNGAWQNGAQVTEWVNGTWTGELWTSEFWQAEARHDLLRDNPYTAKVLQYIYSCAMKTGTNRVIDAGGGISVTLTGGVGLAPTWDSPTGACDETCQRWVSACVLARTNAYGVTVDISMRVPDTAPTEIKEALALGPTEATDYPNREGTYFGNIFATTPTDSTGQYVTNTPRFLACAGPYSNLPDLTKRFVSSQGDGGPVQVLGTCEPHEGHPAACAGLDGNDVEIACFGPPARSDGTPSEYDQVITVYLKTPITNCGNSVCETGETTDACPSDCHPGTSAVNLGVGMSGAGPIPWGTQNATPTPDGNVLVGNVVYGSIDLGGGPTNGAGWNFVLAKYTRTGRLLWSNAYGTNLGPSEGFTIATASNGTIAILVPDFAYGMYIAELTSEGSMLPGWPINVSGTGRVTPNGTAVLDSAGNLYMSGTFDGTATIGAQQFTSPQFRSAFFAKLASDGTVAWATPRYPTPPFAVMDVQGLALDPRGSVIVEYYGNGTSGIDKLDAATGAVRWHVDGEFHGAAVDGNGDVYASFDRFNAYLLKLSGSDGREITRAQATRVCDDQVNPSSQGPCTSGILTGLNIALDNQGNVLMSSSGGGGPRGFDFGAGEFRPYGSYDSYISAYRATDLKFRWAKHVPFILDGGQNSFTVDSSTGAVTMIGAFSGSMLFDDRILVNSVPEIGGHQEVFIASFNQPSILDTTPPVMTDMPNHIVVQATSAAGAIVWYSNPLATDAGNSGTNVVCSPAANTFFPIGDTTVQCVAYDPLGNKTATQSFVVTVEDNTGPIFSTKPLASSVQQTTSGMVLQYDLPLAFDEIANRYVTVTCTPPSGSSFVTNTDIAITCSAVDINGNTTSVGYLAYVTQNTSLGTGADSYSVAMSAAIVPKITIDGPGVVEATEAGGAHVAFSVTTDGLPPTCSKSSGDLFPLGESVVTCTTTNLVGFSNSTIYRVLVQDTTAPKLTVVPPPGPVNATSSSGAIVSYPTSATDAVTATPTISCNPPSGSLFAIGSKTVTCTATDAAGNSTSSSFSVTVVNPDSTPPVITVPANITVATTTSSQTVTFAASATDNVDGTDPVTCSPSSGSTFTLGTTTVTCTAHDAAGNTAAPKSFTVTVLSWSFFLQPINTDGSSIFKQGNTIPVKFQLTGASAAITNLGATIRVQKVSNSVTGNDLEVVSTSAADTGTTFRYDPTGGIYIFNLSTANLSAGTYSISANVSGNVLGSVNVSLKK